ncbi:helix-hairpin-helix domain-containing protein [Desulforamulus aeronauticus]|uniref:Competence protein ComEA n=1 Tax=Desulforamulus aeronauticus DSM 10349 TaxID=1121421 RepID=A0A1M6WT43_9FIRM|nr:helix-hairpin-helix domain-containing protein [Desulforamulus aeronauticus]SHK96940.1 competence protein ComEA [Desulforamulus aeronauticus DSM 10349]
MFNLGRKEQLVIIVIAAILLFTAGYRLASRPSPTVELVGSSSSESTPEEGDLLVHVTGAVEKPGLYKLPPGSRVNDAIERAGALPEADLSGLNLAARLKDEHKLIVPSLAPQTEPNEAMPLVAGSVAVTAPVPAGKPSQKTVANTTGKVNINTAGISELDSLPGIGPALAERIIQYRQANGLFQSPQDLMNVSGIGEKKFADLEQLITVQ